MLRSRRTRWSGVLLCAALVGTLVLQASPSTAAPLRTAPLPTAAAIDLPIAAHPGIRIPARDGVELETTWFAPTTPGRYPLVVFPSSWGFGSIQNTVPSLSLAAKGFVVINYATRGFGGSDGEIAMAGPDDVRDVSDVIDWALTNTPSDPTRIGAAGISYSAGITLMAAAQDPRIRVEVAIMPWVDLAASIYPFRTRSTLGAQLLQQVAGLGGRPSAEFTARLNDFLAGRNLDELATWAAVRSPLTYLDGLNRNRPAVLMVSGLNDFVCQPGQTVPFFEALRTVKHMQMRPGDHSTIELPGLFGLDNGIYAGLVDWFSTHLRGVPTAIASAPELSLTPRTQGGQPPVEQYPGWSAVTTRTERQFLGPAPKPGLLNIGSAPMTDRPGPGWRHSIAFGQDSQAQVGLPAISHGQAMLTNTPPSNVMFTMNRNTGAIWRGPIRATGIKLRGASRVHIGVVPQAADGTVILTLYDDDGFNGYLITHQPYSWHGATPGVPLTIDVPLYHQAYDVKAGHRVSFVVTTADQLYSSDNLPGSRIVLTSPAGDPASLDLALGG